MLNVVGHGPNRTGPCASWEDRAAQLWQLLEDVLEQDEMFPEASAAEFKRAVLMIVAQRGLGLTPDWLPVPAVRRAGPRNGWG